MCFLCFTKIFISVDIFIVHRTVPKFHKKSSTLHESCSCSSSSPSYVSHSGRAVPFLTLCILQYYTFYQGPYIFMLTFHMSLSQFCDPHSPAAHHPLCCFHCPAVSFLVAFPCGRSTAPVRPLSGGY